MPTTAFKTSLEALEIAKREWSARLIQQSIGKTTKFSTGDASSARNVVGVGIGEKQTAGKDTGDPALKFLVVRKLPKSQLLEILPQEVDGIPTDVEEVGVIRAQTVQQHRGRMRPARPGCSIGCRADAAMAGTFGALVYNEDGIYILSNNHVLADENNLPLDTPIYQPGLLDDGKHANNRIARLNRFVNLDLFAMNRVDAALARLEHDDLGSPEIIEIGRPSGVAQATMGMRVRKFGRTTGLTAGRVGSVNVDVKVEFETGVFIFEQQMLIKGKAGPFSEPGDSGSLIMAEKSNVAVGLLFAGSETHTIGNDIAEVLRQLAVQL